MRWLPLAVVVWGCPAPAPAPVPQRPPAAPNLGAPARPIGPDARALLEDALRLRSQGDDFAAADRLDAALAAEPGLALAALERADLASAIGGDPERTLADARLAAEAMPDNPRALRLLGQGLEETGDLDGAIAAYGKSLELKLSDPLRRKLAALHARAGHTELAVAAWEAIRDGSPEDVGARLELARSYEAADRPASAEKELVAAAALAPQNASILRRLADLQEKQGKAREGRASRAKADAIDPPPKERRLRALPPSRR